MYVPLFIGAALSVGAGVLCSEAAGRRAKELEFLRTSQQSTMQEVTKELKSRKSAGLNASGDFEVTGVTYAPQQELIKARMDGEQVVLSRIQQRELVDVPHVRSSGQNQQRVEWVREERELSSFVQGGSLGIADKSSFKGTGVSAKPTADVKTPARGRGEGLETNEEKAGVSWLRIDRGFVPGDMWVPNGVRRESAPSVNVNVGGNPADQGPRVVGIETVEHIVPRGRTATAIGNMYLDADGALRIRPVASATAGLSMVVCYGTGAEYRADALSSMHSFETASKIFLGLGAVMAVGGVISATSKSD